MLPSPEAQQGRAILFLSPPPCQFENTGANVLFIGSALALLPLDGVFARLLRRHRQ